MAFKTLSKSEKSYIQASLQAQSPLRADGRPLHKFRSIALQTGTVPLANGSAHLNLGRSSDESMGGTEVLAAAKLEVENIGVGCDGVEGGRVVCTVSWCVDTLPSPPLIPLSSWKGNTNADRGAKKSSPAAYSYLSAAALDDLQHDYSATLHDVLSHASLRPPNLGIIPGRKAWLLTLDLMVLSDAGNVYDALFMAARAALWDTHVPRTRAVEYRPDKKGREKGVGGDMDVDSELQSGLDTRRSKAPATDFELEDYWDDGAVLGGRDAWPVGVTLNLVLPFPHPPPSHDFGFYRLHTNKLPGVHFLDATNQEEAATPLRLILAFSFRSGSPAALHGMHLLGTGDTDLAQIESLAKVGASVPLLSCESPGHDCLTGGGKVRAGDIHGVECQVERRRITPDGESAPEVRRSTMNSFKLQLRPPMRETSVASSL
jgi:exosome complex component RRP42